MNVVIFNPYGTQTAEAGILAASVRMLQEYGHSVSSLSCDGCFAQCDRGMAPESGLARRVQECFVCISDQQRLNGALSLLPLQISNFLNSKDIEDSHRAILSTPRNDLSDLTFQGESLAWLCRHSLKARFGSVAAAFDSEENVKGVRELLLSAIRTVIASSNAFAAKAPNLVLIVGRDVLSESCALGAKLSGVRHGLISARGDDGSISLFDSESMTVIDSQIRNLSAFRVSTPLTEWDKELHASIRDLLLFYEVPVVQMTMFAANHA